MPLDPVAQGDPHVPVHNEERDAINALRVDVDKKINSPALGLGLGAMLRWDGDNWVPSKTRLFEGTGSPEGVIAAPVGSRYVDATAAGGNAEWFKMSGEGNTGWNPLNTGIGWTNISPGPGFVHAVDNPGQMSMLNGVVFMRGALRRTSGSGGNVGSYPIEMAPEKTLLSSARVGSTEGVLFNIQTNGSLSVSPSVASNQDIHLTSISGVPYRANV